MAHRRGMGKGRGRGYYNMVTRDPYVHSMSAKGQKQRDLMRAVIRFEDLNPDYPSSQMLGIASEIDQKYQHEPYIDEKIENTKRFYTGALDNFGRRIKNKDIQKEFKKRLKEGKLDAKKTQYRSLPEDMREQLQDLYGNEVPEYLDIVNKNRIRIKVEDWRGRRWIEITPKDVIEYYDTQARNITSGVRNLAGHLGDWRNIDALAKESLEIFKITSRPELERLGKKRGMTLRAKSKLDARYELSPRYDSRKSFYRKAIVETDNSNKVLYSYNTKVAEIKDGKPIVYGTYSVTTSRHIKEFLKQNGFKAETGKQIIKDYGSETRRMEKIDEAFGIR